MSNTVENYQLPMYGRLKPKTEWRGGRITDTDILTLAEAASMASRHAGTEITQSDFLRAARRGEIPLRAIIHRTAKMKPCRVDYAPWNGGKPAPAGAIPTLPLSACSALAITGMASWRTFEYFKEIDGIMCRYEHMQLAEDEPDFVTELGDCRVTGYDVHALADAFLEIGQDEATEAVTITSKARPVQRSQAQDDAILKAIKEAGFDPLALPPYQPGRPSVKKEVRAVLGHECLFAGTTVFDKAWERLMKNRDIAYKK